MIIVLGIIFGLIVVIPIVAILTAHQQKMAEIMRGDASRHELDVKIFHELSELRQLVVEQSLALDDLKRDRGQLSTTEAVKNRLGT
jgi:hypothetical protein